MHRIRRLAKREAWETPEGTTSWNPIARFPNKRRQSDMEALRQTPTHYETEAESARRRQTETDYPPPHRAATEPPAEYDAAAPATARNNNAGAGDLGRVSEEGHSGPSEKPIPPPVNRSTHSTDRSSSPTVVNDKPQKPTLRQRLHLQKRNQNNTGDTTGSEDESHKKKKKHKHIPVGVQLRAVLFGSWINVLLLAVPVGFAMRYANINNPNQGIISFVINIVAIVPLAATLSFATEELSLYVGETIGGLLNATFGNATELIVSVIALAQHKILIVQTSLIGSMLSNLLLVLGMCFFFGGISRYRQHFNVLVAQTASSLLALAIGSLVIPTAFLKFGTENRADDANRGIQPISNGTAVILLLVYLSYLFFQLRTHSKIYNEPSRKGEKRNPKKEEGDVRGAFAQMATGPARVGGGATADKEAIYKRSDEEGKDEEEEEPSLSIIGALLTLLFSTVLIAFCSDFMVSGIDSITGSGGISEEFIGLIVIPIVGNAAEHATAVTVAIKDKMDLAIGVAVGSSIQIALLVFPLVMIIAWCGVGKPTPGTAEMAMTLSFDEFQVVVLFIAVLLVNYLIQDGESHWLEGVLLMSTYLIIAVAAAFYPVDGEVAG